MATTKPVPVPKAETLPYWEGCKRHELKIQKCADCGNLQFYPRVICAKCFSDHVEWVKTSGRGTVLSYTVIYRPVSEAFAADVPYVLALVTLAEGPNMLTNIVGCPPEKVVIGMPVEVTFEDWTDEISIAKFRPA
jgi:uncharacterized OB-fold protein